MDLRRTRRTFVDVLQSGDAAWQSSQSAPTDRRKTVAEDIFLRFVVGWETFVSDWFIGSVNHDAARYRQAVEQRMDNWLQAEAQKEFGRYKATFPRPSLLLRIRRRLEAAHVQPDQPVLDFYDPPLVAQWHPKFQESTPQGESKDAWIFQANPAKFDLDRALAELEQIVWVVRQHRDDITADDRVFIWRSGPQAGIVAIGRVVSDPVVMETPADQRQYWKTPTRLLPQPGGLLSRRQSDRVRQRPHRQFRDLPDERRRNPPAPPHPQARCGR